MTTLITPVFFFGHLREHVADCRCLLGELDVAELALTVEGDLASLALALDRENFVARVRRTRKTQHQHRHRGLGLADRLAGLVEHGANAAEFLTGDDRIAELQRAFLHQHRRHGAATLLDAGLDDETARQAARRRRQLEHLGLQQDGIEQLIDTLSRVGRYVDENILTTPLFGDDFLLRKLGANPIRIRRALVDFVDRHHDRHARRARVLDRLDGLRHDTVIGRHHEHHDVRRARTTSTHRGERGVAWGVEEGHAPFGVCTW